MIYLFAALVILSYTLQNMLPVVRRRLFAIQPSPTPFRAERAPSPSAAPKPTDKSDPEDGTFKPTPIDIVVIRVMLIAAKKLPPDLIDTILDQAEYWAHSTNAIDYVAERGRVLQISGSSNEESQFLVRCDIASLI